MYNGHVFQRLLIDRECVIIRYLYIYGEAQQNIANRINHTEGVQSLPRQLINQKRLFLVQCSINQPTSIVGTRTYVAVLMYVHIYIGVLDRGVCLIIAIRELNLNSVKTKQVLLPHYNQVAIGCA